ncbi:hypothetical protein [Candidatus Albibeggiatoa sp. nov. NOAA]|uniref:hypothetical protein n=1 Tax=Candidatus Albibeggiatoa sp. nov. NOAA TaxID=3162724 RepID=UPI0032F39E9E|nr:hypothetical protein [Thiotrichaceae bacterium]
MTRFQKVREVLTTELEFLLFTPVKPDLKNLGHYYLAFGVITAWIAGVGRYWDNPRAELWQYLGLGSVAYIFILSAILWLIIKPLRPENWSYKSVLIFVGMTSPLAFLYAIPVERYYSLETAQAMNVWFLAIVAAWRVGLLFQYLKHSAKLRGFTIFIAALLPLVIIVNVLTVLNLEHVVFRIMAGLEPSEQSANDAAYAILFVITFFSFLASPILLIAYIATVIQRYRAARSTKAE